MSTFTRRLSWPYGLTVLTHLVTIVQALTLPLHACNNGQNPSNNTFGHIRAKTCTPSVPIINLPINATSTHQPSSLSIPPEPFLYRIPSTSFIIKYTNYGATIPPFDAIEILSTAQEEIIYEINSQPEHVDVAMASTRIWAEGSARLTVQPTPIMRHSACGLILAGMIDCGELYGFIESDVEFLDVEDVFNSFGKGSLLLDE